MQKCKIPDAPNNVIIYLFIRSKVPAYLILVLHLRTGRRFTASTKVLNDNCCDHKINCRMDTSEILNKTIIQNSHKAISRLAFFINL